jgi:hypothetical protein
MQIFIVNLYWGSAGDAHYAFTSEEEARKLVIAYAHAKIAKGWQDRLAEHLQGRFGAIPKPIEWDTLCEFWEHDSFGDECGRWDLEEVTLEDFASDATLEDLG